jgi:hypothetical protein
MAGITYIKISIQSCKRYNFSRNKYLMGLL